jgi:hypothetical protein
LLNNFVLNSTILHTTAADGRAEGEMANGKNNKFCKIFEYC